DPERLYPLLRINAARVGFEIPPLGHFKALCDAYWKSQCVEIWFATYDGKDIAGLLTVTQGSTAYPLYLGLDIKHYDNLKPGYGIYWHAIAHAHQRGCTSANWGTCDSDQLPHEGDKNYPMYWFRVGFGCRLHMAHVTWCSSRRAIAGFGRWKPH